MTCLLVETWMRFIDWCKLFNTLINTGKCVPPRGRLEKPLWNPHIKAKKHRPTGRMFTQINDISYFIHEEIYLGGIG